MKKTKYKKVLKRFDEEFGTLWICNKLPKGSIAKEVYITVTEDVKHFLTNELSRQKRKIMKEIEWIKDVQGFSNEFKNVKREMLKTIKKVREI